MNRVQTYTVNQQIASAELNEIQDNAVGTLPSDANNDLSALAGGMQGVEWQYASNLATGTEIKVDGGTLSSWIDRIVIAFFRYYPSNGNYQPGGSDDYLYDSAAIRTIKGYTGDGARNATNTAPPSNGDPPVPSTGVSWAIILDTDIWLYAKATDGALYMYNNSGATIYKPSITALATAVTGKR